MASEAQIKYITDLAASRDVSASTEEGFAEWISAPNLVEVLTTFNNKQVDQVLTELKKLPPKTAPAPTNPNVQAAINQPNELAELEEKTRPGRYFIVDPFPDPQAPVEKFVKVDKPEPPSRWAGRTFLSSQGSDYFYPIKDPSHKVAIYKEIAKDPINAMNEYGIRLGVCGMCGRTLTARDSRLRGMGPICAGKVMATDEQLDILRNLGLLKSNE